MLFILAEQQTRSDCSYVNEYVDTFYPENKKEHWNVAVIMF